MRVGARERFQKSGSGARTACVDCGVVVVCESGSYTVVRMDKQHHLLCFLKGGIPRNKVQGSLDHLSRVKGARELV